jgi:hypothetical protein
MIADKPERKGGGGGGATRRHGRHGRWSDQHRLTDADRPGCFQGFVAIICCGTLLVTLAGFVSSSPAFAYPLNDGSDVVGASRERRPDGRASHGLTRAASVATCSSR